MIQVSHSARAVSRHTRPTREKLTEELQSDFDRGMDAFARYLDAYRIPILTLRI